MVEGGEVARWEKWGERWGGKVGRKVRWQGGKGGESGKVARWERWGEWWGGSKVGKAGKRGEVARWERWGREVRWQGGKGGGERWGGKVGGSWFYSRVGDAGWVQDFIFLFLMLINRRKGQDEFWIFLRGRRVGKTLLKSNASR